MLLNKDFIIKVITALVFLFIIIKVLGPVLFSYFRSKMPGYVEPDNDIDAMIRRQKERLRAQYGLTGKTVHEGLPSPQRENTESSHPTPHSPAADHIYKETKWGGGDFAKSIQGMITKNYSYTIAETKINAFVLLAEKKKWLRYLSSDNLESVESLKNYLSMIMIVKMLIEEVREKQFALVPKLAKKCHLRSEEFALALQMKILMPLAAKKNIKESTIYSDSPVLHQFSEDTMNEALEVLMSKEANLWAKGHNYFIEEMALHLNYAGLLHPLPKLAHKKDIEGARSILAVDEDMSMEDIKKIYKKIALSRHPDKIAGLKLPKPIELKAIKNFSVIQEAYDILVNNKK